MKLLFLILMIIAGGFGFYYMAQFPGTLHIEWLGYEMKSSILGAFTAVLIFLVLFWFLLSLIYSVKSYIKTFALRRKLRIQEKTTTDFLKGLDALDLNDGAGLSSLLKKSGLPFPFKAYLEAHKALLMDEKELASRHFSTLLDCDELSGSTLLKLALILESQGRTQEISFLLEKIMKHKTIPCQGLKPIYEIALHHGYLNEAKALLTKMNGDLTRDEKKSLEALYYFYQSIKVAGTPEEGHLLEKAFDLYPDEGKITAAYLRLLLGQGESKKVIKKLKSLWSSQKSPELVIIALDALKNLPITTQIETAEAIVHGLSSDEQSLLFMAEVALRTHLLGKAETLLQTLLDHYPSAHTLDLKKRFDEAKAENKEGF